MMHLACAASSAPAISIPSERIKPVSNWMPGDAMLERHAVERLHGDKCLPILLINLVNRAYIWMIECGSSLRFASEATESVQVFGYIVGQEFECYKAPELDVLGLVH